MYKIKVVRLDNNTQIAKKTYESTNKFNKYGCDYFKRKHNNSNNAHHTEVYYRLYKMNDDEKWIEMQIPNEWEIKC